MKNKIEVGLGQKSYDILVGSNQINDLNGFLQEKYSKIFIISDKNVANFHLETLKKSLNCQESNEILVENGENSKNFQVFQEVCEEILNKNIDRKSLIIAFGGGVVGDLSGFVASVMLRGVDFVQIPTTLLACVDSSVGGKTAINSKFGKNLIGSFYQPKLVLCDLNFLKTLPKREIIAGYFEVLKYALIFDEEFFEFLDENYQKIFDLDEEILAKIILKSCEIKAKIVSEDEKEHGIRAFLNFGHTFGHSLEKEASYNSQLNHGEAVGIGMLMASEMSMNLGFLKVDDFLKIKNHIQKIYPDFDLKKIKSDWNLQNLVNNLYKDKKTEKNQLNFILIEKIGKAFIEKNVDEAEFVKIIEKFI